MPRSRTADRTIEALGARLIIAGALDELRADPESFARLLVAIAHVKGSDATVLARLLMGDVSASSLDRCGQLAPARAVVFEPRS